MQKFIPLHNHLPGIPSATEMQKEGSLNIGDMQLKLLEKVEVLTSYVLELKQQNEELKSRLCNLEKK